MVIQQEYLLLTLKLPLVAKKEFLLTTSIEYQADK